MTDSTTPEAGPEGLASGLMKIGALTTDWLPAYKALPREKFVPEVIWPGHADENRQDARVVRLDDPELWRRAVYTDAPITTQWDDGAYGGPGRGTTPSSSNSMPRMVFLMLSALDVEEGHRVLEIGTGTGWNAGLLSHRVGDKNVVSIEVDATVSEDARARLAGAGYEPHLVVGDGTFGCPERAPYDRVIATCSIGRVPLAWIAQTKPGGVIVTPWGPTYGGEGIVRLTVADDGTAAGPFTGSSAFMRLRQQRVERPPFRDYLTEPWPANSVQSSTRLSPDEVGDWIDMFAIGVQVPRMFCRVERYDDGSYTLWLYDTDATSWATADHVPDVSEYDVRQSGPRRLWDELEIAWRWWDAQGRPDFERFGLTVSADREQVWLDHPANPVPARR
ncbi:methyltransferase domain-containing protein [Yinghuangia sp. YIM S10712]|uniref:methyltransferase domain-containing protein n=1 Tax=Yinghuangia sp. YIM S10712 TaxID=3436930 RepID=UPI003F52DB09